jgi:hypothetical protein
MAISSITAYKLYLIRDQLAFGKDHHIVVLLLNITKRVLALLQERGWRDQKRAQHTHGTIWATLGTYKDVQLLMEHTHS